MTTTTYPPYTARQCTICDKWIGITITVPDRDYPSEWEEGGEDYAHFEDIHPEVLKDEGPNAIGFPYCNWNDEAVTV